MLYTRTYAIYADACHLLRAVALLRRRSDDAYAGGTLGLPRTMHAEQTVGQGQGHTPLPLPLPLRVSAARHAGHLEFLGNSSVSIVVPFYDDQRA
jgi:hypothetical protein